jgi:hypothetical protein
MQSDAASATAAGVLCSRCLTLMAGTRSVCYVASPRLFVPVFLIFRNHVGEVQPRFGMRTLRVFTRHDT